MARYGLETAQSYTPNHALIPGLVNPPAIFIAPSALTGGNGEIWLAVSGSDTLYGGCYVWASNDGDHYINIGKHVGNSTHGHLTSALATGSDTDISHTLAITLYAGELATVSQKTVDTFDSLCRVGNEFLAYRDAVLTGATDYELTYLKRGLYGTTKSAANNAGFVLCNNALFKYRFNQNLTGETLYFKLQAFNTTGGGLQDLADLIVYSVTVSESGGVIATQTDLIPINDAITVLQATTGGDGAISFGLNAQTPIPYSPIIVCTLLLTAKTYTQVTVFIGCGIITNTATLQLKTIAGTVLDTLTNTGGVAEVTSTVGFTLASDTVVNFILSSSSSTDIAIIKGLYIK